MEPDSVMNRDNVLAGALLPRKMSPEDIASVQADIRRRLDMLAELLDNPPPPPKKLNLQDTHINRFMPTAPLPVEDVRRAEELCRRVAVAGGTGSTWAQEGLLSIIMSSMDPGSVPFWLEMLDFKKARDQFAPQRRMMVVASLAMYAAIASDEAGWESLRKALRHARAEVRADTLFFLREVLAAFGADLPGEILPDIRNIALEDPSFLPRFQARQLLWYANDQAPIDYSKGAFVFKVTYLWAKGVYRTLELRSTHTLDDLHVAIQRAYGWGADHLYTFYMSGEDQDQRYEIPCYEVAVQVSRFDMLFAAFEDLEEDDEPGPEGSPAEREDEDEDEEEGPLYTGAAVIGALGLLPGHNFLYMFDYGDHHLFRVEVVGVKEQAEKGRYPRVTEKQGKAPPQYPDWDEDEE